MNKWFLRIGWWLLTLLYISLIYLILPYAPTLWSLYNGFLLGNGVLSVYIVCFIAIILIFFHINRNKKPVVTYLLFFLLVLIAFILNELAIVPAEKVHLLEYGLLSIIFYNALKIDISRYNNWLYVVGSILCSVTGFYDERIQLALPNRYFSWRDVILNIFSSILAFLIIRFVILTKKQNPLQSGLSSARII